MKISTTTALGFVLSLTSVLAAPIQERAVQVVTVYETYYTVTESTATVWVPHSTENGYAPASTSSSDYEGGKSRKHGYETPSVTTTPEVIVGTPTSYSSTSPSTLSTSSSSSESSSSESSSSESSSSESSSSESSSSSTETTTSAHSTPSSSVESTSSTSTEPTSTIEPISATQHTTSTPEPTTSSISIPSKTIEIPTTLTSIAIPTTTITPETTTTPAVTQIAPSSAVQKSVETTAASSGSMFTGEATYYSTGLGACGITNVDSDPIVAVSVAYFGESPGGNPNKNVHCGQKIKVWLTATPGSSIIVTVTDKCQACAMYDLDFSPTYFQKLGCTETQGRCPIQWEVVG